MGFLWPLWNGQTAELTSGGELGSEMGNELGRAPWFVPALPLNSAKSEVSANLHGFVVSGSRYGPLRKQVGSPNTNVAGD